MSIASIASGRPRNIENWFRFPNQAKAIGSEESDEHVLLGDLIMFVEKSDQSIPQIAELLGVSDVALSMWMAGTARPTAIKLLEIKRFFELSLERSTLTSVPPFS